jgi:hypothetical protein
MQCNSLQRQRVIVPAHTTIRRRHKALSYPSWIQEGNDATTGLLGNKGIVSSKKRDKSPKLSGRTYPTTHFSLEPQRCAVPAPAAATPLGVRARGTAGTRIAHPARHASRTRRWVRTDRSASCQRRTKTSCVRRATITSTRVAWRRGSPKAERVPFAAGRSTRARFAAAAGTASSFRPKSLLFTPSAAWWCPYIDILRALSDRADPKGTRRAVRAVFRRQGGACMMLTEFCSEVSRETGRHFTLTVKHPDEGYCAVHTELLGSGMWGGDIRHVTRPAR